ncbi:AHH domain-containing protein, partial [Pseudomonas syringae]|uniref:AHH domain-containing protein n=2 Tax=Pseudomonas TaxID=286 RepID=UPI0015A6ADA6
GMNIHKVSNIIYLPKYAESHPTRTIHRGSHADYTTSVEKQLDSVHKYGVENGWTKGDYDEAVNKIIATERKGLRSGTTRLNSASVRGVACG